MNLSKRDNPKTPNHQTNDAFIRPSASQILQMNKDNPDKQVSSSDFIAQPKLNHWGAPSFIQPMRQSHAKPAGIQRRQGDTSSKSDQTQNKNGLPNNIKNGAENLSGHSMDDVKVHYNSDKPESIGALAYAQGTDIHLASGQEKHLPHEAWHVVQQKQGRVNSGAYQAKLGSVNTDSSLEAEADTMGAKMMSSNQQQDQQNYASSNLISGDPVIQRIEVPTNFGKFETTKFDGFEDKGVDISLKFHPDETKVDSEKIALIQSAKSINESGEAYALDPNTANKMVKKGDTGAGYAIDQFSDVDNPIYSQNASLGEGKTLEDTPDSTVAPSETTNYEGHCYRLKPGDTEKDKSPAGLWDQPSSKKKKGRGKMFETTALSIKGADKDTYYGSVKWGYKMEGTDAAPTLTKFDITEASKGTPTKNFIEPAKLWNSAKTRGTLIVGADPEATVLLHGETGGKTTYSRIKLTKDTKLKQLNTVTWGTDASITCKVLTGVKIGETISIKNTDVVDSGDGSANKKLPIV